jgi:hypothetical protein
MPTTATLAEPYLYQADTRQNTVILSCFKHFDSINSRYATRRFRIHAFMRWADYALLHSSLMIISFLYQTQPSPASISSVTLLFFANGLLDSRFDDYTLRRAWFSSRYSIMVHHSLISLKIIDATCYSQAAHYSFSHRAIILARPHE